MDGFIFDLDGVLIDSNAAHVKSWLRAFRRFGYNVELDRLAIEMGKGGDKLVPNVLGDAAEARRGSALRAAEKEEVFRVALEEGLWVAPGGQELLAELRRRQVKTAVATSSGEDQLDIAERGTSRVTASPTTDLQKSRIVGGIRAKDSRQLLDRWRQQADQDGRGSRAPRHAMESTYVSQLLDSAEW